MSAKSERDNLRRRTESDPVAPFLTLRDAAPLLRRPFTPEAVRFKVVEAWADTEDGQPTADKPLSHATIAPYVDARAVIARLNLVCPDMWSEEYAPQSGRDGALMWCSITMTDRDGSGDTVTRRDIGSTYDGKGLVSDALKRAAVKFGVGESLYAVPPIHLCRKELASDDAAGPKVAMLKPWRDNGEPWLKLTRAGEEHARDIYRRWLLARGGGIDSFGKPLSHGNLTMRGEAEGEGPPMPVMRPGEKRDTPARGRGASRMPPAPTTTSGTGEPVTVTVTDPEELAAAELSKVLAATDGLQTLRDVLNATMIAQGVTLPSERLRKIVNAGDKRGLSAAITQLGHAKAAAEDDNAPFEQREDTT